MFSGCINFNQELNWNTGNVTDISNMYHGCSNFKPLLKTYMEYQKKVKEQIKDATSFNDNSFFHILKNPGRK